MFINKSLQNIQPLLFLNLAKGFIILNQSHIKKPRFEFRVFGENFKRALSILSNIIPLRENIKSSETYIVIKNDLSVNIKIRDNSLEIKTLIENNNFLQKWKPVLKIDFPLDKETLKNEVFPYLKLNETILLKEQLYSQKQFLQLFENKRSIIISKVKKERTFYIFESILCEVTKVNLQDSDITTLCLETENKEELKSFISFLKLDKIKNTSYPKMLASL